MDKEILSRVAEYLAGRGYVIVDRDWRGTEGAVDLFAAERREFVAVLVKARARGRSYALPENMSQAEQRRLRRLAAEWLRVHGQSYERIGIDVVECIAEGPGGYSISHTRRVGT
jgi:putative endonuclease